MGEVLNIKIFKGLSNNKKVPPLQYRANKSHISIKFNSNKNLIILKLILSNSRHSNRSRRSHRRNKRSINSNSRILNKNHKLPPIRLSSYLLRVKIFSLLMLCGKMKIVLNCICLLKLNLWMEDKSNKYSLILMSIVILQ